MKATMDYAKFGSLLKTLRRERRLTQQKVCDELGISNTHYSNIENGMAKPSMEVLMALVNYYNLTLSQSLYTGEENYKISEEVSSLFKDVDDSTAANVLDVVAFANRRMYES